MAVTSAVNDLIASVYELLASLFSGVYNIVHSIITAVLGLFTGFFTLMADVFSGVVDVVGGLGKFVAGNIVVIGIIAAAGYGFVRYQQTQGRSVTSSATAAQKKTT
ncbi:hypothetical protein QBC46DRAFT_341751 [Diplogelasinospora grovesii]|uniref:Uncharacterized protein n=1 Tax=Diplogelasinospora grovesii TaxID=303347 RepID=A0AAN6S542_9PEZI|nr:hypothetical protein QBC46DRAFT_341751 [Diplogelasinospora grovesii]